MCLLHIICSAHILHISYDEVSLLSVHRIIPYASCIFESSELVLKQNKTRSKEPSSLVINNSTWPLKAQCCESFSLNHCSLQLLCPSPKSLWAKCFQILNIMQQKPCNPSKSLQYWFSFGSLCDIHVNRNSSYTPEIEYRKTSFVL